MGDHKFTEPQGGHEEGREKSETVGGERSNKIGR